MSGGSSPLSQTATLVNSPDIKEGLGSKTSDATLPPSAIVEYYSSKASSAVFLYDLARDAGFGSTTQELAKGGADQGHATAFDVQSRAGAGLFLLGRLSEGTSSQGSHTSSALTAYTTPPGLAQMAPSLNLFSKPIGGSRLVLQVPAITHHGLDMVISPTLSQLSPFFSSVPEHFTILLSATPQEIIDFAALSYTISQTHIVHIFDHWSGGRETSRKQLTPPSFEAPVLDIHAALQKAGYEPLEYVGDKNATNVVVAFNGPLALCIKSVVNVIPSFGLVTVKVLRPWDEAALRKVIPASTTQVLVIDDVLSASSFTPLYHDVLGALAHGTTKVPRITSQKLDIPTLAQLLVSAQSLVGYLSSIIPVAWFAAPEIPAREAKRIVFYSSPSCVLSEVPTTASQLFLARPTLDARFGQIYDTFAKPGGAVQSTLLLGRAGSIVNSSPISFEVGRGPEIDSLVVLDPSLLKSHDLFSGLRDGAPVLVFTSSTTDEVLANLSAAGLDSLKADRCHLITLDAESVAADLKDTALVAPIAVAAFLRLYLGKVAAVDVVTSLLKSLFGKEIRGVPSEQVSKAAWEALRALEIPTKFPVQELVATSKVFSFNSLSLSTSPPLSPDNGMRLASWVEAGKGIIFREAYATPETGGTSSTQYPHSPSLRPDILERTFLVTCTVNLRLTPMEYDRNVFHLEFDTSGTGLKYEIGEALGVHGWNDADDVLEFCKWYGVNPNDLVSLPVPGASGKRHLRTVFQALQQQIDIFGKPPKSFYEALAAYAATPEHRMALRFIGAAEGASTFKTLSEKETVTFADVLQKFSGAHPSLEVLCEMVGDIKPRHYSIASAQSAVGDRVHLLVVTVDWLTPSGAPRFGQCTRYLAGLKTGQKVTVSIKPSVMKLPPDNMQPIIMAGLGTGYVSLFLSFSHPDSGVNVYLGLHHSVHSCSTVNILHLRVSL
jgi:sulfite reductase (NADPH) flavoprotein alpha-component